MSASPIILDYETWFSKLSDTAAKIPVLPDQNSWLTWYNALVLEAMSTDKDDILFLESFRKFMFHSFIASRIPGIYRVCPGITRQLGRFKNYGCDFDPEKVRIGCFDVIGYHNTLDLNVLIANTFRGFTIRESLDILGAEILTIFCRNTLALPYREKRQIVTRLVDIVEQFGSSAGTPTLTEYVGNALSAGIALMLLENTMHSDPVILGRVATSRKALANELEILAVIGGLTGTYPFLYELGLQTVRLDSFMFKMSNLSRDLFPIEHMVILSSVIA